MSDPIKKPTSPLWRALRWPLMIGIIGFSGVFFMLGLIQNFGYTGTTPLRSISQKEWDAFSKQVVDSPEGAKVGAPYYFVSDKPTVTNGVVKFDKRLVSMLSYLSGDRSTTANLICGWKGRHEAIGISIKSTEMSKLSKPSTNAQSASTVYRGVGIRIAYADRIKCTQFCPKQPLVAFHPPGFEIPLAKDSVLKPTDPVTPGCQVMCAVDYYPPGDGTPVVGADSRETVRPLVLNTISLLDPSLITPIPYDPPSMDLFSQGARQAAIYKTVQLAYELMHADDKGCMTVAGNSGSARAIPYTIIFPGWVYQSSTFAEKGMVKFFLDAAKKNFPFFLQTESPNAGEAYDPLLTVGLHFNY